LENFDQIELPNNDTERQSKFGLLAEIGSKFYLTKFQSFGVLFCQIEFDRSNRTGPKEGQEDFNSEVKGKEDYIVRSQHKVL
jgi:hypothetical protein